MSKRVKNRLNPGLGIQEEYGYGPKLSRRGIDEIYSTASQSRGTQQLGGCSGPFGTPGTQAGGLKAKDIVNSIKKGVAWAKKNKPLEKVLKFADSVVPEGIKMNPIYMKIREVAGQASKQLGIGQSAGLMGQITYNKGMSQPLTARPRRKAVGGSKRAKPKSKPKQKGAGRKRKSKK